MAETIKQPLEGFDWINCLKEQFGCTPKAGRRGPPRKISALSVTKMLTLS